MDILDEKKELARLLKAMGYEVKTVDEGKSGVVITVSAERNNPRNIN